MNFDEWWKKHWCKDIQATSKHENACRYAYTDALGLSEQKIKEVEDKLSGAIKVLKMVEDNTKMPHQHTDPQLRLYCLAERAKEFLENLEKD